MRDAVSRRGRLVIWKKEELSSLFYTPYWFLLIQYPFLFTGIRWKPHSPGFFGCDAFGTDLRYFLLRLQAQSQFFSKLSQNPFVLEKWRIHFYGRISARIWLLCNDFLFKSAFLYSLDPFCSRTDTYALGAACTGLPLDCFQHDRDSRHDFRSEKRQSKKEQFEEERLAQERREELGRWK